MGISRFNSEGYYDPTAHEAVCNIEKEARKWRPLVYICSPYSGDVDRNTEKARRYCRFAVDQGAIPLAAHMLLPQFMSETKERDLALFMDMVLMGKCEQVWVFGEKISSGMAAEIAKRLGVKVDEADNIVGDSFDGVIAGLDAERYDVVICGALHRSERKNITCQIRMESS